MSTKRESDDMSQIIKDSEANSERKTDWISIYIATILSFVGSVQFSLYFSSLWPYMQLIDRNITESFFGYTVALYSFGQIIISPVFGWWSNKIKRVSPPLITGLCLMLTGNVMYILMEVINVEKRWILLVLRFITGMGSGNVAVIRSYASTASTTADRAKAIALVTCGQALGMTTGPLFQLVFTPLKHPGIKLFNTFSFSIYTAPAYMACIINITAFLLILFRFKEYYAGVIENDSANDSTTEAIVQGGDVEELEDNNVVPPNQKQFDLPPYDVLAIIVCYATRFTDMFVRTNLETLGSPYAMMMFSLNANEAVRFMSTAQGCIGGLTLLTYVAYIFLKLDRWVPQRSSCMIALCGMMLFHLTTFSWPFLPAMTLNDSSTNFTVGCNPARFTWCNSLGAVNVYLFFFAYIIIIGLSFPLLQITLNTLFSKIIGPRRQGIEQGLLQISSGVGRMVGPVGASALYTGYGPNPVWLMEMAVIGSVLVSWFVCYKRMVPLKIDELKEKKISVSTVMTNDPREGNMISEEMKTPVIVNKTKL